MSVLAVFLAIVIVVFVVLVFVYMGNDFDV